MLDFEVLLNAKYLDLAGAASLLKAERKWVLAFANDFEDGEWRQVRFNDFIWNNIAETALSAKERALLVTKPSTMLRLAAKNLRLTDADVDPGAGSEIAEIALYGVMRDHFGALPVVPKIFYKQNVNDNAKGADSVHIVVADGGFTLWLGEAKFYNKIEDARLAKVIESLGELLSTEKLKKENAIITNISDLDELVIDESLRAEIKAALSADISIDKIKPILNVPILLLYECSFTAGAMELSQPYRDAMFAHQAERATSFFKKQISALSDVVHGYERIKFHLVFFPVPNKQVCVDAFLAAADAKGG